MGALVNGVEAIVATKLFHRIFPRVAIAPCTWIARLLASRQNCEGQDFTTEVSKSSSNPASDGNLRRLRILRARRSPLRALAGVFQGMHITRVTQHDRTHADTDACTMFTTLRRFFGRQVHQVTQRLHIAHGDERALYVNQPRLPQPRQDAR